MNTPHNLTAEPIRPTPSGCCESYLYDAVGNRLNKQVSGGGLPLSFGYYYLPNSHRLMGTDSKNVRLFDANGNTTRRDKSIDKDPVFFYDERNRFNEVRTVLGVTKQAYRHNARGERVFKQDNLDANNTRRFNYDESGRLISKGNAAGAALAEYLWLEDLPVGVISAGTLYHIQPDLLGAPRKVILPATNTTVWRWPFMLNPFGDKAPLQDPDGNGTPFVLNLRFPGQYFDAETGLHYNYFRDYEPGTGRYIQSDPIGLRGGMSTYGYVGGNPIVATDSRGLEGVGPQHSYEFNYEMGQRHAAQMQALYALLEQWRLWGHNNYPGEQNSAMRHCTVSCITGDRVGTPVARVAGVGNEPIGFLRWDIPMLSSRMEGTTPWAFQLDDLANNERGLDNSDRVTCGQSDGLLTEECVRMCAGLPLNSASPSPQPDPWSNSLNRISK